MTAKKKTDNKSDKNVDNREVPEMEPTAEASLEEARDAADDSPVETPSVEVGEKRKDSINMTFDEVSESEDPYRDVTPVPRELDDERSGYAVTRVEEDGTGGVGAMAGHEMDDLEVRIQNRDNYYEDADITPDNDRDEE